MIGTLDFALTWCPAPTIGEAFITSCLHWASSFILSQSIKRIRDKRWRLTVFAMQVWYSSLMIKGRYLVRFHMVENRFQDIAHMFVPLSDVWHLLSRGSINQSNDAQRNDSPRLFYFHFFQNIFILLYRRIFRSDLLNDG
jgi:hypothetical protein